jgi:hypothetical protein
MNQPLVCAVHNEPLADCPCKEAPGIKPTIYKVKPFLGERDEEFKRYLSKPDLQS